MENIQKEHLSPVDDLFERDGGHNGRTYSPLETLVRQTSQKGGWRMKEAQNMRADEYPPSSLSRVVQSDARDQVLGSEQQIHATLPTPSQYLEVTSQQFNAHLGPESPLLYAEFRQSAAPSVDSRQSSVGNSYDYDNDETFHSSSFEQTKQSHFVLPSRLTIYEDDTIDRIRGDWESDFDSPLEHDRFSSINQADTRDNSQARATLPPSFTVEDVDAPHSHDRPLSDRSLIIPQSFRGLTLRNRNADSPISPNALSFNSVASSSSSKSYISPSQSPQLSAPSHPSQEASRREIIREGDDVDDDDDAYDFASALERPAHGGRWKDSVLAPDPVEPVPRESTDSSNRASTSDGDPFAFREYERRARNSGAVSATPLDTVSTTVVRYQEPKVFVSDTTAPSSGAFVFPPRDRYHSRSNQKSQFRNESQSSMTYSTPAQLSSLPHQQQSPSSSSNAPLPQSQSAPVQRASSPESSSSAPNTRLSADAGSVGRSPSLYSASARLFNFSRPFRLAQPEPRMSIDEEQEDTDVKSYDSHNSIATARSPPQVSSIASPSWDQSLMDGRPDASRKPFAPEQNFQPRSSMDTTESYLHSFYAGAGQDILKGNNVGSSFLSPDMGAGYLRQENAGHTADEIGRELRVEGQPSTSVGISSNTSGPQTDTPSHFNLTDPRPSPNQRWQHPYAAANSDSASGQIYLSPNSARSQPQSDTRVREAKTDTGARGPVLLSSESPAAHLSPQQSPLRSPQQLQQYRDFVGGEQRSLGPVLQSPNSGNMQPQPSGSTPSDASYGTQRLSVYSNYSFYALPESPGPDSVSASPVFTRQGGVSDQLTPEGPNSAIQQQEKQQWQPQQPLQLVTPPMTADGLYRPQYLSAEQQNRIPRSFFKRKKSSRSTLTASPQPGGSADGSISSNNTLAGLSSPLPSPGGVNAAAEEYLQLGITAHEKNEMARAAHFFEQSATLGGGCGFGMLMWGMTLRHGWGVKIDEREGFAWVRRAADAAVGDLEAAREGAEADAVKSELVLAIFEVGQCYAKGWGVKVDMKLALSYFQVAARLGDCDAQLELGFCFTNGRGCKKDKKEAAKWYRAAAAQGASTVGLTWIFKDKYT